MNASHWECKERSGKLRTSPSMRFVGSFRLSRISCRSSRALACRISPNDGVFWKEKQNYRRVIFAQRT
jgi:hypothetical protein